MLFYYLASSLHIINSAVAVMWWSIFEIGLLLWHHWKWTGGVETSFCWTKYMWQGYFAIKLDQFPFFGLAWCSENFTPAYRGSPPPAVFHDKSQMTNMKNTAGKSARLPGAPGRIWAVNSDRNSSVWVELDIDLHPSCCLEVISIEWRLAELAYLVLLIKGKRVARLANAGICR